MNRFYQALFILITIIPSATYAQTIKFSDFDREDTRDINFEIIGKLNNRVLIYKNIRSNHRINIYDGEMKTLKSVNLDFIPARTFNIDFVVYPDYFYMIYQYQKGRMLHCMSVKMNPEVQMISDPVEIDTTQIPVMSDNKIYTTIYSEDKQKIAVFKIQTRYQKFDLTTLLFDSDFKLIDRNRYVTDFNEKRESYDNFLLSNEGSFIFTYEKQAGYGLNSNVLSLIVRDLKQASFSNQPVDLADKYFDNVKLKIDNLNKRYIVNSFYYKKNRGSIDGLFTYIWDKDKAKAYASGLTQFDDSLRDEAKREGLLRFAMDDYLIRQVIVKKDGGFILTAEDFSSDTRGNTGSWNRYDYLYNPSYPSSGYYYYNPYSG